MQPLDVILAAMRRRLEEGDEAGAVALAKAAAPYVHPRASARGGAGGLERLEDGELDGAGGGGGAGSEAPDPDEPG